MANVQDRWARVRIRWAAIGAAVAVSLGGGAVWVAQAAGDTPSAVVPIEPCRLMDTRSGSNNVGPRSTPIGPGETYEVNVWGTNGNCTIPAGATGIVTNTTVTGGTSQSYLTLFPGPDRPVASSLNWVAGQAPTPNQVTVALTSAGKMQVYNHLGTANVIVDVVAILRPDGVSQVVTRTATFTFPADNGTSGQSISNHAQCLAGETLVSGGWNMSTNSGVSNQPNVIITYNRPALSNGTAPTAGQSPTGWFVQARRNSDVVANTITVYAVCANG